MPAGGPGGLGYLARSCQSEGSSNNSADIGSQSEHGLLVSGVVDMQQEGPISPWAKFDPSVISDGEESKGDGERQETRRRSWWWRPAWFTLDAVSLLFWAYALTKVFVVDVDRWVVSHVAPELLWLVDLRLLIILVLTSLALILLRKARWAWLPAYIAFFPLVVLLWKIPRFLYRRRSLLLVIGCVHIFASALRSLRFAIPMFTTIAVSAALILAGAPQTLQRIAVIALLLSWTVTLVRAFAMAMRPSWFVRGQRKLFQRLLTSEKTWNLFTTSDLQSSEIEILDNQQANQLMLKAGTGLLAYRGTQFWAMKVEEYRDSGISMVFAVVAILLLLLQGLVTFSLINASLYQMDPSQFSTASGISAATIAHYSLASFWMNEIAAMTAAGAVSAAVNVVAGISTGFVLLILVVTVLFGFRQGRDAELAREEIAEMRRRADDFAEALGQEHRLSVGELQRRLDDLGYFLARWAAYLAEQLERPDGPGRHAS